MKKRLNLNAFLVLFLVLGIGFWLAGCQDNSVGPETIAPSMPTNLVATAVDSTTVVLTWTASTDNVVVCWYNVYRGSSAPVLLIGTSRTNSFRDTTVAPGSVYAYAVEALDCSQNVSPLSGTAIDTTTGTPQPDTGSVFLGSAAPFGIFSAEGITSTGNSVINGDIGMTPGTAYVGFSDSPSPGPGTHTGTLHINDGVALQAKIDFQTAYTDLFGRACPPGNVSPSLTGPAPLTPGVYCFPSTAGLGTLVLDGQGDPNALFIFQIGSSLTTAPGSSVTTINGATPGNVFWVIYASATLGTGTAFEGTIICQVGSIVMNTGATINDGRAATITGAITLDNSTITVP